MDIWALSILWLLLIALLETLRCMCFESASLCLWDKYLVVQLLSHRVVLFLTFWGNSMLFSRVAAPVCIPTSNAKGFPFLSIHSPIPVVSCVVIVSHSDRCEVTSHCSFDLHFFECKWWIMLSIFSCVRWSSVYLLWKNVCSCSIHIKMFVYFWERLIAWAGKAQRERETQYLKQAPGSELSAQSPPQGSNTCAVRSWPEPKLDALPTEPLKCPYAHFLIGLNSYSIFNWNDFYSGLGVELYKFFICFWF